MPKVKVCFCVSLIFHIVNVSLWFYSYHRASTKDILKFTISFTNFHKLRHVRFGVPRLLRPSGQPNQNRAHRYNRIFGPRKGRKIVSKKFAKFSEPNAERRAIRFCGSNGLVGVLYGWSPIAACLAPEWSAGGVVQVP